VACFVLLTACQGQKVPDAGAPTDLAGPVIDLASSPPDATMDTDDGMLVVDAAVAYGYDVRPTNATCKAFTAPPVSASLQLVDQFPNIPLDTPTGLFQRPGDNTRWYVTQRDGLIVRFPNDPAATGADMHTVLDLTAVTYVATDCSMSGIAFPPDFATSKHAYVSYCYGGPETGGQLQVRVSRFASSDGGDTLDPASEQLVFSQDFQYDANHPDVGLHESDAMRFGPDGYLYFSIGDGGPQGSIGGHQAQDTNDLRGKLHRIDPSDFNKELTKDFVAGRGRVAADIPADNPFVGGGGAPSIYAYGFRNPWQWHFDSATNKIWLGDVGNDSWEEVDRDVQKGGNYGWGVFEGTHCTGYFANPPDAEDCTTPTLIQPLLDYAHGYADDEGHAVTGGIVYRGTGVPSLTGAYIFGDSSVGHVWAVHDVDSIPAAPAMQPLKDLLFSNIPVSAFAEDQDGELYATILYSPGGAYSGRILKLAAVPASGMPGDGPPPLLSQTGCFDANDPSTPVDGVIPFAPSAQLWSDGATKRRWLALPDDATIDVQPDGDFIFPPGSVLMKEFSVAGQRVETRFFVRQVANGKWAGYTYAWNGAQTDATLQDENEGSVPLTGGGTWTTPSHADCAACHTTIANTNLGPEVAQLNHAITYPSGVRANQLETLAHIGLLTNAPTGPQPSLAAIDDPTRSIEDRARGYLHANCSGCHRPGGPTFTPPDFRYATALHDMGICNVPPTIDDLLGYIPDNPMLFAPGDPQRSVMWWRDTSTDPAIRMPPLMRTTTLPIAAFVLSGWISSTTACP
jgi:uncharacterized repeat protein (TIGR03806 family)